MPAKKVRFSGVFYWAKVYEGNHDEYDDKQFYKITVDLDDESWAKFSKLGTKLKKRPVTSDEDAPDGITFRRDLEPKIVTDKKTGKKKGLGGGAPKVFDKDGDLMTPDQMIANGSEGEITVEFYKTAYKGRTIVGHRLEEVHVTKYIPYEPDSFDEEFEEDEEVEEEKPVKKKKVIEVEDEEETPVVRKKRKLDDDIPF